MSAAQYIGSQISLISKSDIRYVGILYAISPEEATISLERVRSLGSEDRKPERIPASDSVYDFIVFKASDIRDLKIEQPSASALSPTQVPDDPAIVNSQRGVPSTPANYPSYPQYNAPYGYPIPQHPSYGMQPYPGPGPYQGYPPYGNPLPQQQQPPQPQQQPPRPVADAKPVVEAKPVPSQQPAVPPLPNASARLPSPAAPVAPAAPQPVRAPTAPKADLPPVPAAAPAAAPSPAPARAPLPAKPTGPPSFAQAAAGRSQPSQPEPVTATQVEQLAADMNRLRPSSSNRGRPARGTTNSGMRVPSGPRAIPPRTSPNPSTAPVPTNGAPAEFDFEKTTAQFEKQSENEKALASAAAAPKYEKASSFFDTISSELTDGRLDGRFDRREETRKNVDTFGEEARSVRGGGRGRGYRGRGGRGRGRGGNSFRGAPQARPVQPPVA